MLFEFPCWLPVIDYPINICSKKNWILLTGRKGRLEKNKWFPTQTFLWELLKVPHPWNSSESSPRRPGAAIKLGALWAPINALGASADERPEIALLFQAVRSHNSAYNNTCHHCGGGNQQPSQSILLYGHFNLLWFFWRIWPNVVMIKKWCYLVISDKDDGLATCKGLAILEICYHQVWTSLCTIKEPTRYGSTRQCDSEAGKAQNLETDLESDT